jgi:hypothetical protein
VRLRHGETTIVLTHDLTIALRRFKQQRFHTAIGIAVLTFGLVCFLAANLFVGYIRDYDRHFSNADRIYIVAERMSARDLGLNAALNTSSDAPVAEHLRLDVPELAAVARARTVPRLVSAGDRRVTLMVGYVEAEFADIFRADPARWERHRSTGNAALHGPYATSRRTAVRNGRRCGANGDVRL